MLNISRVNKAAALAALYNASKAQGMGLLHYDPSPMSVQEAASLLEKTESFDYLKGRVMKINLSGSWLDPRLYDRDNGEGVAARALAPLGVK